MARAPSEYLGMRTERDKAVPNVTGRSKGQGLWGVEERSPNRREWGCHSPCHCLLGSFSSFSKCMGTAFIVTAKSQRHLLVTKTANP